MDACPPDPLKRRRIKDILPTGVRAIDGFLTCGEGQRIGIFAGSGVGKSTTLGMIRSEEHTSELQSRQYLVCRLLLEKKKKQTRNITSFATTLITPNHQSPGVR